MGAVTCPSSPSDIWAVLLMYIWQAYFSEAFGLATSSFLTVSVEIVRSLQALPKDVEAASLGISGATHITKTAIRSGSVEWAKQGVVL